MDIIEAGFPAASKEDFEAVKEIAHEVGNAVDGEGTSGNLWFVLEIARSMVKYARNLGSQDVEFSPEDAGRLVLLKFEALNFNDFFFVMEE